MVKWADYCISNVRHNNTNTYIEQVKVRQDLDESLGVPIIWERADILDSLRNNESFCTIIEGTNNNWNLDAYVEIVNIKGIDYIKTVKDSNEKDDLGKLPTF
jgi:hypothetical protein